MRYTLYEIFEHVGTTKNRIDASTLLKRYKCDELLFVLRYMFNDEFPKPTKLKALPYNKLDVPLGTGHSYLGHNMSRLNLCLENSTISEDKKLNMLMGILGGLYIKDAEIVEKMFKNQKLRFKRVTEPTVRMAFPELLPEKKSKT